jgi:hypothetical protein
MFNSWKIVKLVPLANLKVDYEPTEEPIACQRGFSYVPREGYMLFVVHRFLSQIDWTYD